jgi:hypothetical protein
MSTVIYYLILAILTVIVIVMATKTCLLRDIVIRHTDFHDNATKQHIADPKAPFSLARVQLAFWTVIIFSSFLYVLFHDKFSIPELNKVNLILLGIAVSTTAAGKLIDDSQKGNPDLSQDNPSQGFLIDILSDKNGVSIHRLQNVLWSIGVGIIYIHFVSAESKIPDETVLTDNLLLLMGISTGAYVGIKATENAK